MRPVYALCDFTNLKYLYEPILLNGVRMPLLVMYTTKPFRTEPNRFSVTEAKLWVNDLIFALKGKNDLSLLKLAGIDHWDSYVDESSAQYIEPKAHERAARLPDEQLEPFMQFIEQYLSHEEKEGWIKHDFGTAVRWYHPDIEVLGHAKLDELGCPGSRREPIAGYIKAGFGPVANVGFDLVMKEGFSPIGSSLHKRMPFVDMPSFEYTIIGQPKQVSPDPFTPDRLFASTFTVKVTVHGKACLEAYDPVMYQIGILNNLFADLTGSVLEECSVHFPDWEDALIPAVEGVGQDVVFIDTLLTDPADLDIIHFDLLSSE